MRNMLFRIRAFLQQRPSLPDMDACKAAYMRNAQPILPLKAP